MTVYIYGLLCPLTGATRYIGKSIRPERRLIAHIGGALRSEYNHHTARWIRKLHAAGLRPTLVILQIVEAGQDWRSIERAWIEKAQKAGWPITNSTAGGEGLDYIDPEAKAKYLKNLSTAVKARMQTEAGKENLRKMNAAGQAPSARAKRIASVKQAWQDTDKGARMQAFLALGRTSAEAIRKRGEATKRRWSDDPEKMIATIWTPEARAKQSAGRAADWANPETRERLMNRWTPEARVKQAEELAKRQDKIQAARTPEVIAKQAATLKATWAKRKAAKLAATAE